MRSGSVRAVFVFSVFLATASRLRAQGMATLKGHKNTITCLAFSKDGKLLASGAKDGTAIIWDVKEKKALASFPGHTEVVPGAGLWQMAHRSFGLLSASRCPGLMP
jgi:WD40 repeat protein